MPGRHQFMVFAIVRFIDFHLFPEAFWEDKNAEICRNSCQSTNDTLQGTNISPKNGILKMIFLFPRWDSSLEGNLYN